MRVSTFFGLLTFMVSLTINIQAALTMDQYELYTRNGLERKMVEGDECSSTKPCKFPEYHICTGDTGCQPFLGSLRSPCDKNKNSEDCQFGLSCQKDRDGLPPKALLAYIKKGGSQKPNSDTEFYRCLLPPFGQDPRKNNKTNAGPDDGTQFCKEDEDCHDNSCIYGVCLPKPGSKFALCANDSWCAPPRGCYNSVPFKRCIDIQWRSKLSGCFFY